MKYVSIKNAPSKPESTYMKICHIQYLTDV